MNTGTTRRWWLLICALAGMSTGAEAQVIAPAVNASGGTLASGDGYIIAGTVGQPDDVVGQFSGEFATPVCAQSLDDQPGRVQPGRAPPVALGVVSGIGEIEARHSVNGLVLGPERVTGQG